MYNLDFILGGNVAIHLPAWSYGFLGGWTIIRHILFIFKD